MKDSHYLPADDSMTPPSSAIPCLFVNVHAFAEGCSEAAFVFRSAILLLGYRLPHCKGLAALKKDERMHNVP